jgi:hypothetical protein
VPRFDIVPTYGWDSEGLFQIAWSHGSVKKRRLVSASVFALLSMAITRALDFSGSFIHPVAVLLGAGQTVKDPS